MSFRANLLKKMEIDKTAGKLFDSIKPVGSIHKVDRESMKYLLELSEYRYEKRRDLDLYYKESDEGKKRILVLDNDLSIYHTTIDDVVIRKSPYVKEMVSIRNVIKILNDGDVVVSKKEASVRAIQKECIEMLDLSFDENDLAEIEKSGTDALAISDTDTVLEAFLLFGEILEYVTPPKSFVVRGQTVLSRLTQMEDDTKLYGPIVLYNNEENKIKLMNDQIKVPEKEKIAHLHKIASGRAEPDMEGADVFTFLKKEAEKKI
jgi:hypothetical protein